VLLLRCNSCPSGRPNDRVKCHVPGAGVGNLTCYQCIKYKNEECDSESLQPCPPSKDRCVTHITKDGKLRQQNGAQPFSLSAGEDSQPFALPCSQQAAECSYPESEGSNPFNSSKKSLPFRFIDQKVSRFLSFPFMLQVLDFLSFLILSLY
jgi:hypothetical protein